MDMENLLKGLDEKGIKLRRAKLGVRLKADVMSVIGSIFRLNEKNAYYYLFNTSEKSNDIATGMFSARLCDVNPEKWTYIVPLFNGDGPICYEICYELVEKTRKREFWQMTPNQFNKDCVGRFGPKGQPDYYKHGVSEASEREGILWHEKYEIAIRGISLQICLSGHLHKRIVEKAVVQGKRVPVKVLSCYPELFYRSNGAEGGRKC